MVTSQVNMIAIAAKKAKISAMLLLSICSTESNLRNVNHFNGVYTSLGVCQLKLATARGIDKHLDYLALQQPEVNFGTAAKLINKISMQYKNESDKIAVYNYGSLKYDELVRINECYVMKTLKWKHKYDRTLCFVKEK